MKHALYLRRGAAALLAAAMVATSTPLTALAEAEPEAPAIEVVDDEAAAGEQDVVDDGLVEAAEAEELTAAEDPAAEPVADEGEGAPEAEVEPETEAAEPEPEAAAEPALAEESADAAADAATQPEPEESLEPQASTVIQLNKQVTLTPGTEYVLDVPADGYLSLKGSEPRMKDVSVSAVPFDRQSDGSLFLRGTHLITAGWCGLDSRTWGQNTWVGVKKGRVYLGTRSKDMTCTFAFTKDDYRDYDSTARPIQVKKGDTVTYSGHAFTGPKDGPIPFDYYTFKLDKATKVSLYVNVLNIRESNIGGLPHLWVRIVKGTMQPGSYPSEDDVVKSFDLAANESDFERNEYSELTGVSRVAPTNYADISLAQGEYTLYVRTNSLNCNYQIGLMDQTAQGVSFPDVPEGHWAKGVVTKAVNYGLLSGYDDGRFGTNDRITRAQVAVVLWNMRGKPAAGKGAKSFPDVKAGSYYYSAVRWASSVGVVNGYADGRFGSNDPVTREQLAVMLANYAKKFKGADPGGAAAVIAGMSDGGQVSGYARDSVGWCFAYGVLSGSNGKILPKGMATRAEAAKMFVKVYEMR